MPQRTPKANSVLCFQQQAADQTALRVPQNADAKLNSFCCQAALIRLERRGKNRKKPKEISEKTESAWPSAHHTGGAAHVLSAESPPP